MIPEIPYVEEARPDTGVSNGTVGILLFLASEVMFFGALVASYTLLRLSAQDWHLDLHGTFAEIFTATLFLLGSSTAISFANARSASRAMNAVLLGAAGMGALAFLVVKGVSLDTAWQSGLVPSFSTAAGLFYTFSGLHALHVLGGGVWAFSLIAEGARDKEKGLLVSRKRKGRLLLAYWTFVDLVWFAIVVLFYIG